MGTTTKFAISYKLKKERIERVGFPKANSIWRKKISLGEVSTGVVEWLRKEEDQKFRSKIYGDRRDNLSSFFFWPQNFITVNSNGGEGLRKSALEKPISSLSWLNSQFWTTVKTVWRLTYAWLIVQNKEIKLGLLPWSIKLRNRSIQPPTFCRSIIFARLWRCMETRKHGISHQRHQLAEMSMASPPLCLCVPIYNFTWFSQHPIRVPISLLHA